MQRAAAGASNARVLRHVVYDTRLDTLGTGVVRTLYRFFDDYLGGRVEPAEQRYGMTGDVTNSWRGYVKAGQEFPVMTGSAKALGEINGPQQLPQTKASVGRRGIQRLLS